MSSYRKLEDDIPESCSWQKKRKSSFLFHLSELGYIIGISSFANSSMNNSINITFIYILKQIGRKTTKCFVNKWKELLNAKLIYIWLNSPFITSVIYSSLPLKLLFNYLFFHNELSRSIMNYIYRIFWNKCLEILT